ncbi:MAG TPA: tetraacyldisaccharide 4'-kinase [Thermoanaerobaculaceae bacterium]|nr:tetraacyldisaccharide 4'-kinase [Thermoanaerobaculaceae bacterium]HRS16086.1 tetraacyldisaccharide 4'-kinase [Thermoanaerobaculaceae bacterium]
MNLGRRLAVEASGALEAINAGARLLYRWGVRRVHRAEVPVISVGNIACGGTGKTPLVAALARVLTSRGRRPAILTRGYRRESKVPLLITGQRQVSWREAGDEPALLARALPEVPIVVDRDRVRGAATAVREVGATHLLLDDGFQHWRLGREADIVVVDAADPLALEAPRRERPAALRHATGVVINRVDDRSHAAVVMAMLGPWAPDAAMIATRVAACAVHRGGERAPAEALRGQKAVLMAGLGNPRAFAGSAADLGVVIADMELFPDHHRYRRADVESILARAYAAGAMVLTTGKDFVKLPPDLAAQVAWLEVELQPVLGSFADLIPPAIL